jgi:hypothetical protein
MDTKRFIVIVHDSMENEHSRIPVDACTHREATLIARGQREWWHWPRGATFTPRLADTLSYPGPALWLDSQAGALYDEREALS